MSRPAAIRRISRSVASFFVSRIDTMVDKQLDEKIAKANDPTEKERLAALKGKVAIANAKMAYQDYKRLFSGARWEALAAKGAKPQRLLWASTGTKNKDYSDVALCRGADRPQYRQHRAAGDARCLPRSWQGARQPGRECRGRQGACSTSSRSTGISLDAITAELVKDGVKQFADAADKLYGAVAHKRADRARRRYRQADYRSRRRARQEGGEGHRRMARRRQDSQALAKGRVGLDRQRRA